MELSNSLSLYVAANGGRAAAWAVDEAQAQAQPGQAAGGGRGGEGGKALTAKGLGAWSACLDVPSTQVPGHLDGMHALRRCGVVP